MRVLVIAVLSLPAAACSLAPTAVPAPGARPQAVVFDIDGTLTPTPRAIRSPRTDAATAARRFADQGVQVVYLSARVRLLQAGIPEWLRAQGFPPGPIHVPQGRADSTDPAAFKTGILRQYRDKGWRFVAAYGDSSTDFHAYAAAGIAAERVYALRRAGETACQPGIWRECLVEWTPHLATLSMPLD
jgi:trehalose-6-phosphatase